MQQLGIVSKQTANAIVMLLLYVCIQLSVIVVGILGVTNGLCSQFGYNQF